MVKDRKACFAADHEVAKRHGLATENQQTCESRAQVHTRKHCTEWPVSAVWLCWQAAVGLHEGCCFIANNHSLQFNSVAQSSLTVCDPMDFSTPGFLVHHQLPELAQTHVHRVGDAIQSSQPLLMVLKTHSLAYSSVCQRS